ncbi:MAG: type II secretion system F family protein, partial [Planctomycetaceae bacterium]|nr:type II secretion system F family protein [Planctomycetaceae bacterium]
MDIITIIAILMSSALYFLTFFLGVLVIAPCWDEVSTKYCGELCNRFDQLGIGRAKLRVLLRLWGVLLLVSLLVGWGVQAIPLGIFVAALVAVAPVQVLQFLICRHEATLDRQMVQASAALANSMRAGMSLKQALEAVAADTPEPLKQHLDRIVFEATHGRPLIEALRDVRRRLD